MSKQHGREKSAKLHFIIRNFRRMRYPCAAWSEYLPFTLNELSSAICACRSNRNFKFWQVLLLFPWRLIVAINNMLCVYNSFIIQENVWPLQWVSRKHALILRSTIRKNNKITHSFNSYGRRQEFSLQSFLVSDKTCKKISLKFFYFVLTTLVVMHTARFPF